MRLEQLKTLALSHPQTTVVKQWGETLVFKVAGKIFLMVALDGALAESIAIKCTPEEFDDLTEIEGIGQAPYCAKRHWVKISDLGILPAPELGRRIQRSFELVVAKLPKKTRSLLG